MTRPGARRVLPLAIWIVALGVGTVLFHAMGDGPLAAPPLSPSAWGEWVEGRDPLIATIAVLRLVVLGLSWYLVGATSIGILARLLRAARLVRLADALTVPALRHLLQGALGVSLATAMVASATPQGLPAADDADETSSITAVDDPTDDPDDPDEGAGGQVVLTSAGTGPDGDAVTLSAPEGDGEVTLERVEQRPPVPLDLIEAHLDPNGRPGGAADDAPSGAGEPDAGSEDAGPDELDQPVAAEDVEDARVAGAVDGSDHVVVSGESLWTIARDALVEASGAQPSDTQVTEYWQQVIESNRDRLADPDNPDLIFPGQQLALPAVDGAVR